MADAVKLRDNGTVQLELPDDEGKPKQVNLAVPTIGQIRELEDLRDSLSEPLLDLRDELTSVQSRLAALADDDSEAANNTAAEVNKEARALIKKQKDLTYEGAVKFLVATVEILGGDFEVGNPDKLPAWASDASLANKLLRHWREVPLDRSK